MSKKADIEYSEMIASDIINGEHTDEGVKVIFEASRNYLKLLTFLQYANENPDKKGKPIVYNTVAKRKVIKVEVAGIKFISNKK